MLSMLSVSLWLNLIRSTRGLWNIYWDTWEELQTWLIPRAKRQDDDLAMGYVDSDYVGDLNNKRSLTGYLFTINYCTKQLESCIVKCSGLSTAEVEYTTAAKAFKEAIWLRGILNKLWYFQTLVMFSVIAKVLSVWVKIKFIMRKQNIDIKLHFIRLEGSKGIVQLVKIHTNYNIADMLTKINSNY